MNEEYKNSVRELYEGIYIADHYLNHPSHFFSETPILGTAIDYDIMKAQIKAQSEAYERLSFHSQPQGNIVFIHQHSECFLFEKDREEKEFFVKCSEKNKEQLIPLRYITPFIRLGNTDHTFSSSRGFAAHFSKKKALHNSYYECLETVALKKIWFEQDGYLLEGDVLNNVDKRIFNTLRNSELYFFALNIEKNCVVTLAVNIKDNCITSASGIAKNLILSLEKCCMELLLINSNFTNEKFAVHHRKTKMYIEKVKKFFNSFKKTSCSDLSKLKFDEFPKEKQFSIIHNAFALEDRILYVARSMTQSFYEYRKYRFDQKNSQNLFFPFH